MNGKNKNMDYNDVKEKLKKMKISEDELIGSKIYEFIISQFNKPKIFFANITSMCLKKSPEKIRIRNDSFLQSVKQNELSFLLVGLKINEKKKLVLCFCSKSFLNYSYSTNQSNSFISQDFSDINENIFDSGDVIEYWSYKKMNYPVYVSQFNNFDKEIFLNKYFSNVFIDNPKNNEIKSFFVPNIPRKVKEDLKLLFDSKCLMSITSSSYRCPCGNSIDLKYLNDNNLSYIHFHHFVPKEFFIKNYNLKKIDSINWNVVHNPINLIPLCQPCHQSIHKGKNNKELTKKIFDSILDNFKLINRYNHLSNYVNNILKITYEDIFNFYVEYEVFKDE